MTKYRALALIFLFILFVALTGCSTEVKSNKYTANQVASKEKDPFNYYYSKGLEAQEVGDMDIALLNLEKALSYYPKHTEVKNLVDKLKVELGENVEINALEKFRNMELTTDEFIKVFNAKAKELYPDNTRLMNKYSINKEGVFKLSETEHIKFFTIRSSGVITEIQVKEGGFHGEGFLNDKWRKDEETDKLRKIILKAINPSFSDTMIETINSKEYLDKLNSSDEDSPPSDFLNHDYGITVFNEYDTTTDSSRQPYWFTLRIMVDPSKEQYIKYQNTLYGDQDNETDSLTVSETRSNKEANNQVPQLLLNLQDYLSNTVNLTDEWDYEAFELGGTYEMDFGSGKRIIASSSNNQINQVTVALIVHQGPSEDNFADYISAAQKTMEFFISENNGEDVSKALIEEVLSIANENGGYGQKKQYFNNAHIIFTCDLAQLGMISTVINPK